MRAIFRRLWRRLESRAADARISRARRRAAARALGMSYEIADALVEDIKANVWVLEPGDVYGSSDSEARQSGVSIDVD